MRDALISSLVICLVISSAKADEPRVANFVLFPVTTDLQRMLTSSDTDAYGVVNFSRINQGGAIDAGAFDREAFQTQLKAIAGEGAKVIRLYARFENGVVNEEADEQLMSEIKQLCREAGFERVLAGQEYTGSGWVKTLQDLEEIGEPHAGAEEPVVANDLVRVSAVRTRLSRFLTGDAVCFIAVRRPIDGRMSGLPVETRKTITDLIARLEFERKGKLLFRFIWTTAGQNILDNWFQSGETPSPADLFARELGFEAASYMGTPTFGAPETLVGAMAPDFTLEALAGGEIHLRDAIRDRVALITFWGVACGPCRREAPHLSALYEKYKGARFTVIAVNAYDETREKVAKYVDDAKLTHPIALMGGEVARNQYSVGAYPTTFWVDRSGKIADYVIDFEPGDEPRIEASIGELLKTDDSQTQDVPE